MANLDLDSLTEELQGVQQYHLHLKATSELDKYPAKQHARDVALKLRVKEGLIYLAGTPTTYLEDSDQNAPFRQRRYFFYFSGCDESDCHILYDIRIDKLTLYIPAIDYRKAVWGGAGSTKPEAERKYDVDAVGYVEKLKKDVRTWWNKGSGKLYLLHPDQTVSPYRLSSKSLDIGRIDTSSLQYATDLCRVIKDDHEIKLIRQANKVSADAHCAVLANIRSYKNEGQVAAIFLDTSVSEGAKNQAYNIIAGAGTNAAVLHYVANDAAFQDGDVLLIDAGAEWQCYASDVTRTFPISGYWTLEAKDIYDIVDEMQTACIARIKPGVFYRDLQLLAHVIAVDGLMKLGILHNGTRDEILNAGTSRAFFPHGLGHHVGLEVHDVLELPLAMAEKGQSPTCMVGAALAFQGTDLADKDEAFITKLYSTLIDSATCMNPVVQDSAGLQPGMIVTVEPGIYFSQFALTKVYLPDPVHSKYINKEVLEKYMPIGGVRIEDDVLVTSRGYENLTTAPKGDEALKIIRGEEPKFRAQPENSTTTDEMKIVSSQPPRPQERTSFSKSPVLPTTKSPRVHFKEAEAKCLTKIKFIEDKFGEELSSWTQEPMNALQSPFPIGVGKVKFSNQANSSIYKDSESTVNPHLARAAEFEAVNARFPPLPTSPPTMAGHTTRGPRCLCCKSCKKREQICVVDPSISMNGCLACMNSSSTCQSRLLDTIHVLSSTGTEHPAKDKGPKAFSAPGPGMEHLFLRCSAHRFTLNDVGSTTLVPANSTILPSSKSPRLRGSTLVVDQNESKADKSRHSNLLGGVAPSSTKEMSARPPLLPRLPIPELPASSHVMQPPNFQPNVLPKRPQLPIKPLAYRHSMPVFPKLSPILSDQVDRKHSVNSNVSAPTYKETSIGDFKQSSKRPVAEDWQSSDSLDAWRNAARAPPSAANYWAQPESRLQEMLEIWRRRFEELEDDGWMTLIERVRSLTSMATEVRLVKAIESRHGRNFNAPRLGSSAIKLINLEDDISRVIDRMYAAQDGLSPRWQEPEPLVEKMMPVWKRRMGDLQTLSKSLPRFSSGYPMDPRSAKALVRVMHSLLVEYLFTCDNEQASRKPQIEEYQMQLMVLEFIAATRMLEARMEQAPPSLGDFKTYSTNLPPPPINKGLSPGETPDGLVPKKQPITIRPKYSQAPNLTTHSQPVPAEAGLACRYLDCAKTIARFEELKRPSASNTVYDVHQRLKSQGIFQSNVPASMLNTIPRFKKFSSTQNHLLEYPGVHMDANHNDLSDSELFQKPLLKPLGKFQSTKPNVSAQKVEPLIDLRPTTPPSLPVSAARFIAAHGDTIHIRCAAAAATELCTHRPNREKITGDEILDIMRRGTCWAGLCQELQATGVIVPTSNPLDDNYGSTKESWKAFGFNVVNVACGTDMKTLGFWLGDAGVERECRICPVCLDRGEKMRVERQKGIRGNGYGVAEKYSGVVKASALLTQDQLRTGSL